MSCFWLLKGTTREGCIDRVIFSLLMALSIHKLSNEKIMMSSIKFITRLLKRKAPQRWLMCNIKQTENRHKYYSTIGEPVFDQFEANSSQLHNSDQHSKRKQSPFQMSLISPGLLKPTRRGHPSSVAFATGANIYRSKKLSLIYYRVCTL